MALMRLTENVPEVYVNPSRDFQLLLRVYTATINSLITDMSGMKTVSDTETSPDSLLSFLSSRVGFFESDGIDLEELRSILRCFPTLVKNKGSLRCLYKTVTMFLKIKHIRTSLLIRVINRELGPDNTILNTYKIIISTDKDVGDTTILDLLWKYLIPTGYTVEYARISLVELDKFRSIYHDSVTYASKSDTTNTTLGEIRSADDTYVDTTIEGRTVGAVDTFVIYSPGDEE